MGLDITFYEAVERVTPSEEELARDRETYPHELHEVWENSDFPGSAAPYKTGYVVRVIGRTVSFRAGSYSGYNRWRDWLCREVAGRDIWEDWELDYDPVLERPFFQLTNFSDCEGTLGPEVCLKLALDFKLHLEKVTEMAMGDPKYPDKEALREAMRIYETDGIGWTTSVPIYYAKYRDWLYAFSLAGGKGLVLLH